MLSRDGHSYSALNLSSPSFFMSPPALASTPSVPSNSGGVLQFCIPRTPVGSEERLLDSVGGEEDVQQQAPKKLSAPSTSTVKVEFMDLPSLALDRIFIYLSDQDLRAVHQVSKKWRDTLESNERRGDNARRLALIERIRKDEENIRDKAKGLEYQVRRSRDRPISKDAKGEVLLLTDCTNVSSSTPNNSNSNNVQLTPISSLPFQMFAEKEKRLSRGQVLFQCRRCRGPVPSPILSGQSPVVGNSSKIESTKCRLITRMDLTPTTLKKKQAPERKKTKQVPAIDTPTTIALSDIMSQSLVISGAGSKSVNLQSNKSEHRSIPSKLEATFSPVTIDLSLNANNSRDTSMDCLLDMSSIIRNSSFGTLKLHSFQPSPSSTSPSLSATSEVTPSNSMLELSAASPLCNLIVSPTQDSPTVNSTSTSSRQNKTTLALHSKDFIKPKTLTKNSRIPQSPLCGNNNDINFVLSNATKNARNDSLSTSNSKLNTSLIVSGDKERRLLSTNIVTDVNPSPISLPSSHAEAGKDDKLATSSNISADTSDYYSHGSILRHDIDSQSFVPETFSRLVDLANSNTEGSFSNSDFKLRSQSLGNMVDSIDEKCSSFESFSSCPNLSSSFVLECPNPQCSFRFCSCCLDSEHPGRDCRIISSDSIEELHQTSNCNTKSLFSSADANKGKGKGKPVAKTNKGKDKLRRLAKLS